jgi:hypothetical protein
MVFKLHNDLVSPGHSELIPIPRNTSVHCHFWTQRKSMSENVALRLTVKFRLGFDATLLQNYRSINLRYVESVSAGA